MSKSVRNFSAMNPGQFRKSMTKPVRSHKPSIVSEKNVTQRRTKAFEKEM